VKRVSARFCAAIDRPQSHTRSTPGRHVIMYHVGYQDNRDIPQRYSKNTEAKSDCKRSAMTPCSTKSGIVEDMCCEIDDDKNGNSQIPGRKLVSTHRGAGVILLSPESRPPNCLLPHTLPSSTRMMEDQEQVCQRTQSEWGVMSRSSGNPTSMFLNHRR